MRGEKLVKNQRREKQRREKVVKNERREKQRGEKNREERKQ